MFYITLQVEFKTLVLEKVLPFVVLVLVLDQSKCQKEHLALELMVTSAQDSLLAREFIIFAIVLVDLRSVASLSDFVEFSIMSPKRMAYLRAMHQLFSYLYCIRQNYFIFNSEVLDFLFQVTLKSFYHRSFIDRDCFYFKYLLNYSSNQGLICARNQNLAYNLLSL